VEVCHLILFREKKAGPLHKRCLLKEKGRENPLAIRIEKKGRPERKKRKALNPAWREEEKEGKSCCVPFEKGKRERENYLISFFYRRKWGREGKEGSYLPKGERTYLALGKGGREKRCAFLSPHVAQRGVGGSRPRERGGEGGKGKGRILLALRESLHLAREERRCIKSNAHRKERGASFGGKGGDFLGGEKMRGDKVGSVGGRERLQTPVLGKRGGGKGSFLCAEGREDSVVI